MKVLHVFTLPTTAKFFDGQFLHLSCNGHQIHITSSDGDIRDFIKRNMINFFPVGIERKIDIFADLRAIRQIYNIIHREKYDAVFGHTPKGALLSMISAYLARVPNRIYYRHGYIFTTAKGIRRFLFKWIERVTSFLSTMIVNVSPSIGEIAVQERLNSAQKQQVIGAGTCGGIDAKKLFNPQKVDIDRQKLRSSLGISEDDLVIGFCGRICKEKGIRELVDGFKLFRQQHPNIQTKLLIIGNLDKRDILEQKYIDTIHEDGDIICTGTIEHNKVPAYYLAMDIFTLPSYREGFGMCVLEASAMEIPILTSRSHGCIDSIREGETGLYIDISPESIANGIKQLLDPQVRKRLGHGGRQFVLGNFDWSVMWPKIDQIYSDLEN